MIIVGKINIALTSGSQLEKPLISAFNGTGGSYVVLDNEMNGTMGLPIILVAKYNNNRLEKIADQNEWNSVKECLRNIISGNQMNYITVPGQLSADDGFFSQLTLPVASFESLKANYKPIEGDASGGVMPNVMPGTPVTPTTPVSGMPEAPMGPTPVSPTPVAPVAPEIPAMPGAALNSASTVNVGPQPATPVMPTPEVSVTPVAQPAPMPEPVAPVTPSAPTGQTMDAFSPVGPAPTVEPIPAATPATPVDFSADKAAFLKACENMFDALVAKFNK